MKGRTTFYLSSQHHEVGPAESISVLLLDGLEHGQGVSHAGVGLPGALGLCKGVSGVCACARGWSTLVRVVCV